MVFLKEVGFEVKIGGQQGGMQSYPAGRELMTIYRMRILMCSLLNSCTFDL